MRPTFAQIAAGIVILSAGAAVVVLPGRVFGPERVTTPLALPNAQPVALQAHPVKAPVKHRVVTAPVSVAPVLTRAVHVSAPPSKPTTVVRRTVAPRHVVKQVTKQPKVTPKPPKPKPTPPPPTIVPATTPPTLVAAATPPSTSSVVSPKTDTTTPQTPPPGPDHGNGKDHGNGNGNGHGNGHGHGNGQNT